MQPKLIMFVGFLFVGLTLLSRLMEGAYFTAEDVITLNSLTVYRTWEVFGLFSLPTLNLDFFVVGLPKLIMWDYGFFGGGYEIFKYLLYTISMGVVWGVFIVIIVVLSRFWTR